MFNIKNRNLRKQAIVPVIFMVVFGFFIILSIIESINKNIFSGILLSAFFSIFFITGLTRWNKLKKFDDLMSRKTLVNYLS